MDNLIHDILDNDLLFGKDKEELIVGAYQLSDTHIRLFFRREGSVLYRDDPFYPFFFLSEETVLSGFVPEDKKKFWLVRLQGNNFYQYLAIFSSWKTFRAGLDFINAKKITTARMPGDSGHEDESSLTYSKGDAVTQYFLQTGKTLFKGMLFDDVHRLQLDIETYYKPGRRDQGKNERFSDEIIIVSLSDNRGMEVVIHSRNCSEKELLERVVETISRMDPDVIEGHNIFSFDLPYLQRRCDQHGVSFSIGRDGLVPKTYPSSIRFAERSLDFTFFDIPGRHVVDTLFLVQSYDVSKRSLQSYGLKAVAKHFGFASPHRTYIDYEDIASTWDTDHEKLLAYALDDVIETRELSGMLSGSNFYTAQMLPYTYAMTSRLGPAAKIEALFVREYLRQKHSLPKPSSGQQYMGGYTEVFLKGILGPVVYADVESLYPSIMLSYDVCPKSDALRVFPVVLRDLRDLRFKAKHLVTEYRNGKNTALADNFDAMQGSFKILINAMYGYLGFQGGIFNDFSEADRVTSTGQSIARKMIAEFESRGCRVIEVDTDGILFIPPPGVTTEEDERKLVNEVSGRMPDGINIGFDGRFRKMISYLKKNYALLDYNNRMTVKGSSLSSRSNEKFGRDFIRKGFETLLAENIAGLHDLFMDYRRKIMDHELDIAEFSRSETLKSTPEQYLEDVRAGRRAKSITYELVLRAGGGFSKGDRITYYISGSGASSSFFDKGRLASEWNRSKPDENTAFYLKRLDEHCQKFLPFFKPQDFSTIFSADTLFAFSPEGIEIIRETRNISPETAGNNDIL
ncbi:MAG: DNA polymerase [Chlorobi bacterium]|nr:DNA polymerase [Chlorobiota bacterium]